jgi:hypothetical protein
MPDWSIVKIFVSDFSEFIGYGNHDVGKKHGIRTSAFGRILSFFHLGSSDHLHGTGDLTGAFYPLDP